MTNTKKIYNQILSDDELSELVDEESIFDSYPDEVTIFPCVIFTGENQNDVEYADNKSTCDDCSVNIHIFTKAIGNYPTTSEIAKIVDGLFKENDFQLTGNIDQDENEIRHKILTFRKQIFS